MTIHAKFLAEQSNTLSVEEREAIRQLASDIPALWSSVTTTVQERQEIIRLLIERILVTVEGNTEKVSVEIHWAGGYKSTSNFNRPVAKLEQLSYYNELLERAGNLRESGYEFSEIANTLNQEGWKPAKGQQGFTTGMVGKLLQRRGITSHRRKRSDEVSRMPNEFTLSELSQKTMIPEPTLYKYMKKEMLQARRAKEVSHGGVWLITADEQEIKRLQALREKPREWIHRSRITKVD